MLDDLLQVVWVRANGRQRGAQLNADHRSVPQLAHDPIGHRPDHRGQIDHAIGRRDRNLARELHTLNVEGCVGLREVAETTPRTRHLLLGLLPPAFFCCCLPLPPQLSHQPLNHTSTAVVRLALAQKSSLGYWNGKMAWDRVDGKAKRNPSICYSQSYKAWRIARLDGHLAYTIVNDDEVRRRKGISFSQFTQSKRWSTKTGSGQTQATLKRGGRFMQ